MAIWLQGIETAVPETVYTQQESAARVAGWMSDPRERRLSTIGHKASGIEKRHSVITSFENDFFGRDEAGAIVEPTTGQRNARFEAAAIPLACRVAEKLCAAHPTARETVTHLITVSSPAASPPDPTPISSDSAACATRSNVTISVSWGVTPPSRPSIWRSNSVRPMNRRS